MTNSLQLRFSLAAMPLLAGMCEAIVAAGRIMAQQRGNAWLSTFGYELALRLPLSLILAFAVFAVISAAIALLSRLHGASVAAQAARHDIDLEENKPAVPDLNGMKWTTRQASGLRSFQLGRVT